jgi:hypothetical protein
MRPTRYPIGDPLQSSSFESACVDYQNDGLVATLTGAQSTLAAAT